MDKDYKKERSEEDHLCLRKEADGRVVQDNDNLLFRRQFLKVTCTGIITAGLTLPLLQGCTTKDVELLLKPLYELTSLINAYRKQNGLTEVPLSDKLTAVAFKHILDLTTYHPENNCNGNAHSWSKNGNWKGGCYDSNNSSTWPIMWDKPKEIANYSSYGYEVAAIGTLTAQDALTAWKSSPPHNDVILNNGVWTNYPWKAIGAMCSGGYACAWFGTTTT